MECILAIELGGTKLQLVLGLPDGRILHRARLRVRPERGHTGVLELVLGAMPELRAKAASLGAEIARIGIGIGGPVDSVRGVVVGSLQVEGWAGFALADYMREQTGLPTSLYNDTNAATWGEYRLGAGRGSDIFFYTNLGSGIGGGLVLGGALFDGQGCGAAEIGQTYLYNPWHGAGEGEGTGQSGDWPLDTVEKLCSGWAIEKRLRTRPIPPSSLLWAQCGGEQEALSCAMLGQAVERGDPFATRELDAVCRLFAVALSNVISLFSPQVIAIGGGVSLMGEVFLSRLRRFTEPIVFMSAAGRYRIVACELDEDIVPVGVLLLSGAVSSG